MLANRYRINRFWSRWKSSISSSQKSTKESNFSKTVLLPKTSYKPWMTPSKEEEIRWSDSFSSLYYAQRKDPQRTQEFILHDGPPYANGDPHLGHATNKIMKDIICRFHCLLGKKIHFVPGWDCHGLPIEAKALTESSSNDPITRRTLSHDFAMKAIDIQEEAFRSWGILCDWENPYLTHKVDYVINELQVFKELFDRKLLYRDYLPVYWSTVYHTALAEAELEYEESHVSPSIFVKFPISSKFLDYDNCFLLIWTTTPWTLLSNQAISYAPNETYAVVKIPNQDGHFIVAAPRIEELTSIFPGIQVLTTFPSQQLEDYKYIHPFKSDSPLPLIETYFVTMDKGTGLMHTAPNHGKEDFNISLKQGISAEPCLIDENGFFNDKSPDWLKGKFALTDGNAIMSDMWRKNIIHESSVTHRYPYDWRSKKPVIIRPSQQWFMDVDSIRSDCISALDEVNFYPEAFREVLRNEILKRPPWCISRQRCWGVPIPVFYKKSDVEMMKPVLNDEIFEHITQKFRKEGIDAWWKMPLQQLLPPSLENQTEDFVKSSDILDIWLDSGLSWKNVIPEGQQADVYLEGQDQLRGWFQSSLITSVALRRKAPYKNIVVHGFIVDENGRKMSKSEGNVVDPRDLVHGNKEKGIPSFGSDVLRWWVFRKAAQNKVRKVPFSLKQMTASQDEHKKISLTLKFLFGSLNDFKEKHLLAEDQLLTIDRMLLAIVRLSVAKCEVFLEQFNLDDMSSMLFDLIDDDLSAHFFMAAKNRLYCYPQDSHERRSVQSAFYFTLPLLRQMLWPIVPHTIENASSYFPNVLNSWTSCSTNENLDLISDYLFMKEVKQKLNQELPYENRKQYEATVLLQDMWFQRLQTVTDIEWSDFLTVSKVFIDRSHPDEMEPCTLKLSKTNHFECPRCRMFTSVHPKSLCAFCADIIAQYYSKEELSR